MVKNGEQKLQNKKGYTEVIRVFSSDGDVYFTGALNFML